MIHDPGVGSATSPIVNHEEASMNEAIDKQVAMLVEQLGDPSLTASEIETIERKLDVLNRLES